MPDAPRKYNLINATQVEAAKPHCSVCAASGCPAGHVMKGRNCNPPPKRGKAQALTGPAATASTVVPAAAAEGGAMSD